MEPSAAFQDLIDEGDARLAEGRYRDAESLYRKALSLTAELQAGQSLAALARMKLACLYERWGQLSESISHVVEALRLASPAPGGLSNA
jgi:tetratricopeptide (TPR) repeat protein